MQKQKVNKLEACLYYVSKIKEIDKIMIVVRVGQTENTAFEHTINALKNVSAPIGGIILNAVTESHNYGYYYYYYQYYNYYGQDK